MGTSPVLVRFLKTWALLLLLLQVASLPVFSHGMHSEGAQDGAHSREAVEASNRKETYFGVGVAQRNMDVVGGGVGVHAQGHCEGRGGGLTETARSCCALPALEEARLVLSECGSPCCRRQSGVSAAFEGGAQRVEIGSGETSQVGFKRRSAACCCQIKVDFPLSQPVVPPTSAPLGGMVPEFSWTTLRMEPRFTRRCWDPQLVGEARILASVRAQRGAYRVVHWVEGEAVEVLHCSFLL